jgi:hypothetical protein
MIYLKLFENFDDWDKWHKDRNEYFDDYLDKLNSNIRKQQELEERERELDHLYYRLLDNHEDPDEILKTAIDITETDIQKITKVASSVYKVSIEQNEVKYVKLVRNRYCIIKIWRLIDEWYLIKVGGFKEGSGYIYEMCDQIEGLEYLLNKMIRSILSSFSKNESVELKECDVAEFSKRINTHGVEYWTINEKDWLEDFFKRKFRKYTISPCGFQFSTNDNNFIVVNKLGDSWYALSVDDNTNRRGLSNFFQANDDSKKFYIVDEFSELKNYLEKII